MNIKTDEIMSAFYPLFSIDTYIPVKDGYPQFVDRPRDPIVVNSGSDEEKMFEDIRSILGRQDKSSESVNQIYDGMESNISNALAYFSKIRSIAFSSNMRVIIVFVYAIYDFASGVNANNDLWGLGFFLMFVAYIYESLYRSASYSREYHFLNERILNAEKRIKALIAELGVDVKKQLLVGSHVFSELIRQSTWWSKLSPK